MQKFSSVDNPSNESNLQAETDSVAGCPDSSANPAPSAVPSVAYVAGPWQVIDADPRWFTVWQGYEGGERVATIEKRVTNSRGTAHLISAAPDLYEALMGARQEIEDLATKAGILYKKPDATHRQRWDAINAALSKAHGLPTEKQS